ncbi:MAG TPA: mandelate racemase/muconate lactonizing enzyme family protein [Chloroflexia bacterium]|nr:mandelate racemase/muconate lactonizing enzyme family protein [Chloroflexia bacterium]
MANVIVGYEITRFQFPRSRIIGDSQVRSDFHYKGTLELISDNGKVGLGFFEALFFPLPSLAELQRVFENEIFPDLVEQSPFSLVNRISRPRGGNIRSNTFSQAVEQALWDLQGKELNLPLYRLLGGKANRVKAYASGLDFHLNDEEFAAFFEEKARQGFNTFKIKVGHPDLEWDITRLKLVSEVVGPRATLIADANEAWSPKEAISRLHAYRQAGIDLYWIEDPCLRDDFEGLRLIIQEVPWVQVNSGEYLDLKGKRKLLEHRAVDILNIHGHIGDSMKAGWLAAEYGIPVSVGNTPHEIGVHLAAALPEVAGFEYSFLDYDHLVEEPVTFEKGYALVPDRPGHGLILSETARKKYAHP